MLWCGVDFRRAARVWKKSVPVCDVGVFCDEYEHVCVCLDISACSVSVASIPVSVRKARCSTKWRLFLGFLTFRGRERVECCSVVDRSAVLCPAPRGKQAYMFMSKIFSWSRCNIMK